MFWIPSPALGAGGTRGGAKGWGGMDTWEKTKETKLAPKTEILSEFLTLVASMKSEIFCFTTLIKTFDNYVPGGGDACF